MISIVDRTTSVAGVIQIKGRIVTRKTGVSKSTETSKTVRIAGDTKLLPSYLEKANQTLTVAGSCV